MRFKTGTYVKRTILIILTISSLLVACKSEENISASSSEEEVFQTATEQTGVIGTEFVEDDFVSEERIQIQTKYLSLFYPDVYSEVLRHKEVVSDDVAMEVFSMETNESVLELFRIYFGDEAMGITCGYLTLEDIEIPVTYTICQYNDEEFYDEETRILYLETMNCFNDIMNSLQKDSRFNTEKATRPVDNKDAALAYWFFSLPETMECEEQEKNGQYEIRFYGNVAGEKIALYTIFLGKPGGSTVLGTYELNGNKQLLSIESYSVEPLDSWTDEDTASSYAMMGTVNDVLQTIMSSEYFSAEISQ